MAISTIFNCGSRWGLLWELLLFWALLWGLLAPLPAVAEPEPRLGTLIAIEPEALVVVFDDAPEQEPLRIPLTGRAHEITWQPGMAVRVWPATAAETVARIRPIGSGSSVDQTGVRRRLRRGGGLGGRGTPGAGQGGGGRGGR